MRLSVPAREWVDPTLAAEVVGIFVEKPLNCGGPGLVCADVENDVHVSSVGESPETCI